MSYLLSGWSRAKVVVIHTAELGKEFFVIAFLIFFANAAKCQDGADFSNLYGINLFIADSAVLKNKILKTSCYDYVAATGKTLPVCEKHYNNNGLLVFYKGYNNEGESSSLSIKYSPRQARINASPNKNFFSGLPAQGNISLESYDWAGYKSLFAENKEDSTALINKFYRVIDDSSIEVTTTLKDSFLRKVSTRYWSDLAVLSKRNFTEVFTGDSSYAGDTLNVSRTGSNFNGPFTESKKFYKTNLVKHESKGWDEYGKPAYWFKNWDFDNKNRLIGESEYQKIDSQNRLIRKVSIQHDDKAGYRIETIDRNFADSKPDEINYYDKHNKLFKTLYFQYYSVWKNNHPVTLKSEFDYKYLQNGLLASITLHANKKLINIRRFVHQHGF